VDDTTLVEIIERGQESPDDHLGGFFCEDLAQHDSVEKVTVRDQRHDDVDVMLVFEDFLHVDDVGMRHELQNGDFRTQSFLLVLVVLHDAFAHDLDSVALAVESAHRLVHNREFTLTNAALEVIELLNSLGLGGATQSAHPVATLLDAAGVNSVFVCLGDDFEAIVVLIRVFILFRDLDEATFQEDDELRLDVLALLEEVEEAAMYEHPAALPLLDQSTSALEE